MQYQDKQIIIFSEETDATTTDVISWILSFGKLPIRINRDDNNFQIHSISTNEVRFSTSYGRYTLYKGDVFWFRRAGKYSVFQTREHNIDKFNAKSFNFLETQNVWDTTILWALRNGNCLDNPFNADVNKITVLEIATKLGLLVPEWIVAGTQEQVHKFAANKNKIAAKTFTALLYIKGKKSIKQLTGCIDNTLIKNIPEVFTPMIFQKYIEKKYELRSFLFDKKLYSMAIFSQRDNRTKIDFRNYNDNNPNRSIPYNLPKAYEIKLIHLAKALGLDTGSFDILVDGSDNYYFLEVNPVGQFGMVSYPCNYNIEKKVAEYLFKQSKQ
jgi:ATP-GRASP peptide maturase of grasp-with-spasm system